jgi:hypothetical protein
MLNNKKTLVGTAVCGCAGIRSRTTPGVGPSPRPRMQQCWKQPLGRASCLRRHPRALPATAVSLPLRRALHPQVLPKDLHLLRLLSSPLLQVQPERLHLLRLLSSPLPQVLPERLNLLPMQMFYSPQVHPCLNALGTRAKSSANVDRRLRIS